MLDITGIYKSLDTNHYKVPLEGNVLLYLNVQHLFTSLFFVGQW